MMTATFFSFLHDLRFIILLDLLANLAILHKSLPIKYVLTSDVCLTSSNIYRNAIYQIWLSLKKTRLWKRKKQIKTRHYSTRPERMSRRKYIEQEITDIIDKIHMFCHIHTYIHSSCDILVERKSQCLSCVCTDRIKNVKYLSRSISSFK